MEICEALQDDIDENLEKESFHKLSESYNEAFASEDILGYPPELDRKKKESFFDVHSGYCSCKRPTHFLFAFV